MIKAELKEIEKRMCVEIEGEANIVLNEYTEITKKIFKNLSIVLGKDETIKIAKKAFKLGLKRAMEKEGK